MTMWGTHETIMTHRCIRIMERETVVKCGRVRIEVCIFKFQIILNHLEPN